MKNFTFRQYRRAPKEDHKESAGEPADKDSAAYLKRREQVRRAQRTHRERKEAYIKSLENEVLQLRTNEAKITQEARHLHIELSRLRGILDQHGISHANPAGFNVASDSSRAPSISSVSILSNPYQQQQLHVRSGQHGSNDFYLSESEGSQQSGGQPSSRRKLTSFFRSRDTTESASNASSSSPPLIHTTTETSELPTSTSHMYLRDMDVTNLGMEFVLTLEAPCLHHMQGEPNEPPSAPTGHALTTSAPLLFNAPTQPVSTLPSSSTHPVPSWTMPSAGLDKLLSLSSAVPICDDEMTPVQAWNEIRSHPGFGNVGVEELRRLTRDLGGHVKCYGFGAVIERDFFEGILERLYAAQESGAQSAEADE